MDENLNVGVFVATSPDELYKDWMLSTKKHQIISHIWKIS